MGGRMYLILNSESVPLARGQMISPPAAETVQIKVLDDQAEEVARHEIIQLISMVRGEPSLQCHLLRQRDDQIVLERMSVLDSKLRQSLRIPVTFDTFLYPLSGGWKGRRRAHGIDLSIGGVAFFSNHGLEIGERMEIVIPVTTRPLIVQIEILRRKELKNDRAYYAAKFINLCNDEEDMICEAVFSAQLQNRPQTAEMEELED